MLLEEASVVLQVHEESTNLSDSRPVDFGKLIAQQLLGELPKCLALILLELQIIPSIILRCKRLQDISVRHRDESRGENEKQGWRVATILLTLSPAASPRIGSIGVGIVRRSEWARLLVGSVFAEEDESAVLRGSIPKEEEEPALDLLPSPFCAGLRVLSS
jgi:hypothetical protein